MDICTTFLRCLYELKNDEEMKMKSQTILIRKWGPWDQAVGPLQQQLKLMTGGREHCWQQQHQHVIWEWNISRRLRLNPNLALRFSPSNENNIIKAGLSVWIQHLTGAPVETKVDQALYDHGLCQKRLFPIWPHSSIEDFLILIWACCYWYVTGGLADFVSPPELLLDTMPVNGHQCQGQCVGMLGLAPATFVYCLSHFYIVNQNWRTALYVYSTWSDMTFLLAERKRALAEHRLWG